MHDIWIAVITIGGSAVIALIAWRATLQVADRKRKERRWRDLEYAMAAFLAALTKAVAELSGLPHLNPRHPLNLYAGVSRKVSDALFPGRAYLTEQKRLRKVFGERPFRSAESVVDAGSRLRVLGTGPKLANAIDAALQYLIDLGSDRSPKQLERWPTIKRTVEDAIDAESSRNR